MLMRVDVVVVVVDHERRWHRRRRDAVQRRIDFESSRLSVVRIVKRVFVAARLAASIGERVVGGVTFTTAGRRVVLLKRKYKSMINVPIDESYSGTL